MYYIYSNLIKPWLFFILAATFFLYEMMLQVAPSVMVTELSSDLKLTAFSLGLLSSGFYYTYVAFQVPAGMLFDYFGIRKTLTVAISICATGAFIFAHANGFAEAFIGRLLIGMGAAFSATGALCVAAQWLSSNYFGVMPGIIQFLGCLGAIFGEIFLSTLTTSLGWRSTLAWMAFLGFVLAILVASIIRDRKNRVKLERSHSIKNHFFIILSNPQTWWVALYAFLTYAPILTFSALWGVPFLTHNYNLSTTEASFHMAWMWLGLGLGSISVGLISDIIRRRRPPLFIPSIMGIILSILLIYFPAEPLWILNILLFCLGLASSGQALSFAIVRDINQPSALGTAVGFNNMAVVAGGLVFQPLVGFLLTGYDYQVALVIIPICYLLAASISLFTIKETHCISKIPQPKMRSTNFLTN